MARIRTIKPEFPQSESIGALSREARLMFIQLWTLVDDSGRTRAPSRLLASLLYPYDADAPGLIDGWLQELEREGCITRYEVKGGSYLEICSWENHQRIDRPSPSKIPPPPANPREGSSKPREVSTGEGKGREGKGIGSGPRKGMQPSEEILNSVVTSEKPKRKPRKPSGTSPPRPRKPLWDWFCSAFGLEGDGGRQAGLAGDFNNRLDKLGVTVQNCEEFKRKAVADGSWGKFIKSHNVAEAIIAAHQTKRSREDEMKVPL